MDLSMFRPLTEYLMTDTMSVKRVSPETIDKWGITSQGKEEFVYENVKCRVSANYSTNYANANSKTDANVPVEFKLHIFAPYNIEIHPNDKITITRKVGDKTMVYVDKQASNYMQYDNHIEFYIGIDDKA